MTRAVSNRKLRTSVEPKATVHYDGATGYDLGYDTIGILDTDGGNLAACTVAP